MSPAAFLLQYHALRFLLAHVPEAVAMGTFFDPGDFEWCRSSFVLAPCDALR
jgi:hypothetical protein